MKYTMHRICSIMAMMAWASCSSSDAAFGAGTSVKTDAGSEITPTGTGGKTGETSGTGGAKEIDKSTSLPDGGPAAAGSGGTQAGTSSSTSSGGSAKPSGGSKAGGSSGGASSVATSSKGGAAGGSTSTVSVVDDCGAIEASAQTGPVKAVLKASRKCGYPPLAVHFDATGSKSTNSSIDKGGDFHQLKHGFNFGDPNSGTHSLSGLSKNQEAPGGGLAAHVYDNPGTYTVTLDSTDSAGSKASTSLKITVLDPSALATYAISKNGDFKDAPAGAKQLTTFPTFESNSRYFFKSGETWSGSSISIMDPLTNIQVDTYGGTEKPTVDGVHVGTRAPRTNQFARDIRVRNIHSLGGFNQEIGSRVLFYQCQSEVGSAHGISYSHVDPRAPLPLAQRENAYEVFYVDCRLDGKGVQGGYVLHGNGSRLVYLNSFMGGITHGTVRVGAIERGVIRHCVIESPYKEPSVAALKLHSGGPEDYSDHWNGRNETTQAYINWKTSKLVVANNKFGGGTQKCNWTTAFCPQNRGFAPIEPLEDVIVENNKFVHMSGWNGSNLDIAFSVARMTIRGNTAVWEGSGSGDMQLSIGGGHSDESGSHYTKPTFTSEQSNVRDNLTYANP